MINPDNPCWGCEGEFRGRVQKSPCCNDLDELHVPAGIYDRHFQGKDGVVVLDQYEDGWLGLVKIVMSTIVVDGVRPCVNHDMKTGLCLIHDDLPPACDQAKPHVSPLCVKTMEKEARL